MTAAVWVLIAVLHGTAFVVPFFTRDACVVVEDDMKKAGPDFVGCYLRGTVQ